MPEFSSPRTRGCHFRFCSAATISRSLKSSWQKDDTPFKPWQPRFGQKRFGCHRTRKWTCSTLTRPGSGRSPDNAGPRPSALLTKFDCLAERARPRAQQSPACCNVLGFPTRLLLGRRRARGRARSAKYMLEAQLEGGKFFFAQTLLIGICLVPVRKHLAPNLAPKIPCRTSGD